MKLYIYESCPFCVKVMNWITKHNLEKEIEYVDASTAENREALKNISGKTQAPFLVDEQEDVAMPESLDIIAYLAQKYNCKP